jgi:hypothetical protein
MSVESGAPPPLAPAVAADLLETEPTFARVQALIAQPTIDLRQWVGVAVLLGIVAFGSSGVKGFVALLVVILARDVFRLAVMKSLDVVDGRLLVLPLARGIVPVGRSAAREAVSILSGPVFMMTLSLGAFVASRFSVPFTREVALASVVMAAFFLLPLKPYDGWKLLNLCLFSRWATLEAVVAAVTSTLVIVIGVWLKGWFLAAIGALQLLGVGTILRLHRAAAAFQARASATAVTDTAKLDEPTLRLLYQDTRAHFAQVVAQQATNNVPLAARTLAGFMRDVHARAVRQVPTPGASVMLMLIYFALVTYFVVGLIVAAYLAGRGATGP